MGLLHLQVRLQRHGLTAGLSSVTLHFVFTICALERQRQAEIACTHRLFMLSERSPCQTPLLSTHPPLRINPTSP